MDIERRSLLGYRWSYAKCVLTLFVILGWCTGAWAFQEDLGSDVLLDWETTITYGLGMRVAGQSGKSLADINADDGNRSFDKWDLVNNRVSMLSELNLRKGGFGIFVRANAFYDWVYMGSNKNDSPGTHNAWSGNGGTLSNNQHYNDRIEDSFGRDVELLDAYVYADFELFENPTTIRVGRQVVNWGESLLLVGGIGTSQNPLDATKFNTPGAELREAFLPTGQIYAQTTLFEKLTFTGFYKFEWDYTRFNEAGTAFSTSDFLLQAAESILVDVGIGQNLSINHHGDNYASDSGQWGLGARYYMEELNGSELGLFYMNYHENIPMAFTRAWGGTYNSPDGTSWTNFIPPPDGDLLDFIDGSLYYLDYAEDVQLVAFTASGQIGATSYGFEAVYRWDYPIEIIDTNPLSLLGTTYEEGEILHIILNGFHLWGKTFLSDTGAFLWEIGYDEAFGVSKSDLSYDKSAWGGSMEVNFEYLQILDGLDLTVAIPYNFAPNGTSSYVGSFEENADSVGISFKFTYDAVWKFDLGYTNFLHDTDRFAMGDRDWVAFNIKYTF